MSIDKIAKIEVPTDNLYKFLSIFGLIIIIFTIIGFSYILFLMIEKVNEFETQLFSLESKSDYIKDILINGKNAEQIKKQLIEIKKEINKLESERAYFKIYYENKNKIISIFIILTITGFFISMTGFWYWYFKTQQYSDILLKIKVLLLHQRLIKENYDKEETEGQ